MPDLERLFNYHLTDKGSNGYAGVYECLFHDKRYSTTSLLEIGIGTIIPGAWSSMAGYIEGYKPGASLRAWRDYFPNATIYGVDIQPDTQIFNENRICTMLADSRSGLEIEKALGSKGVNQFDIIIDDGSHSMSDQMATLSVMMRYLKPGGTYIIEDVWNVSPEEFVANVKKVIGDLPLFMIWPTNNFCVIANPIKGFYPMIKN